MFVSCECCVLSGRGLCDGLITRPEDSYLLWCVVVCDQETSPWPALGCSAMGKKVIPNQVMETYRGMQVWLRSCFTSELDGRECSNLRSGRPTSGNISSTQRREVWLDPRAILDIMEKKIHVDLTEIEPETHQPPVQLLY